MSNPPEPPVDLIYKELDYRRGKQWDIFSWCSTILVTLIGGLILLQTAQPPHPLHRGQKGIISLAVVSLVAYAVFWIGHHWQREKSARECFTAEVRQKIWKSAQLHWAVTHRGALVLLGIAALLATWYPSPH
jgi:hypothetical protein